MGDATRGPEVTDQEILSVFANADDRRLRTEEALDELPIPEEDLIDRLEDLSERDLLVRDDEVEPGERWRVTSDGLDEVTIPDDEVETEIEAQATKTTGVEAATRDEETPATPPPDPGTDRLEPVEEPVADAIRLFDPPGGPEETEPRRDALRLAYDYLRSSGRANRAEFESDVYPDAAGGYDDPAEWWEQVIRPGLETLPGVEAPGGGGDGDGEGNGGSDRNGDSERNGNGEGEWRFVEDRDEETEN